MLSFTLSGVITTSRTSSRDDVREVVITPESVNDNISPLLVLHPENKKKEA